MQKNQINFIIQASSRSWSGDKDLCMNLVDSFPVIYWTLKKITENFPESNVVVAAPKFDENGELSSVVKKFSDKVKILYDCDDNPLLRMIKVNDRFLSNDYFVRIDGLNMFFIQRDIKKIYLTAIKSSLDCCKFPDDYPAQLTADVYNVNALKEASKIIDKASPYIVHPKYYMFKSNKFNTAFFNDMDKITDEYLSNCRNIAKQIYFKPRFEVNSQGLKVGDQLTFHYQLATEYLNKNDKLLDIACGDGYGLSYLSNYAKYVNGADISSVVILKAKEKCKKINNIQLHVEDVTNMTFKDNTFDVVTSFETIEHVNSELYLKEIRRVLKLGGKLILSTPQNSLGHIPINAEHNHEYSLEEIRNITSKYFGIQKILGIKQGCIIHEDDCKGSNTFMILIKDI